MRLPPPLEAARARASALHVKLNDPEHRRRRREDLVTPLASLIIFLFVVVSVLSYGLLHVAGNAHVAAIDAQKAARRAVVNTGRIAEVERKACLRLQRVRTSANRNGAIIYVVLGAVSANVRQAGNDANSREYRALGRLPEYDPRVDCDEAADPLFEQKAPIPYAELPRDTFLELLPARVVDRILGIR